MTDHGDDEIGIDRWLDWLTADPVRLSALVVLNDRAVGVGELAEALSSSTDDAARHLKEMHEVGLIEVVGEVLSRGTVEPRYRAATRILWSDEKWALLSPDERQELSSWILGMINADIRRAFEAGTFEAREDRHISRVVSPVDEQGWRELIKIQEDALKASFAVHAASAERLAESGEEGLAAMSVMICCELPPRAPRTS